MVNGSSDALPQWLKKISLFEKQIKQVNNTKEVVLRVHDIVRELIPHTEADLYFFDEFKLHLASVSEPGVESHTLQFINRLYSEGILDWVLHENKPQVIPDLRSVNAKGSNANYLLFPVGEGKEPKGVFLLLTRPTQKISESLEVQLVQLILSIAVPKIELLRKNEELSATYNELHVYQSKLTNDFKLSAIGELTSGLAEDILSPLQVIISAADFMQGDETNGNKNLQVIKQQVKKVEAVINRLVKFADLNDNKLEVKPCNLSEVISNYHHFIASSLQASNIECILDLGENIPSVLSHQDYLTHLLATVFGMIKSSTKAGGGILVQTKYANSFIIVRVVTTTYIPALDKRFTNPNDDLNRKMILHLMQKHQGTVDFDANEKSGSSILLTFPLKKKMR